MKKSLLALAALALTATVATAQVPSMPSMPTAPSMPSAPEASGGSKSMPDAASLAQKANEKATVHLNSASQADLQKLPGIGPEKAKAIIAARPFKSVEDLKNVKGIKEAVFAKIKGMVSL